MDAESEPKFICPQCQMGTLQPKQVAFAQWFEGQFITISNFPGWVCDICGACEYDSAALEQLETILGPEADLRREATQRARRSRLNPHAEARPQGRRQI